MTLLYGSPENIEKAIKQFQRETKAIMKDIAEICWFMRGSISWCEAWNLSYKNRKVIKDVINDNIERVKTTGMAIL